MPRRSTGFPTTQLIESVIDLAVGRDSPVLHRFGRSLKRDTTH
jgi:hypothetical protein